MNNFCPNCGKKVDENAFICTKCGALINDNNDNNQTSNVVSENKVFSEDVDNGSFWWGVLGFFQPIAGLVFYFYWKKNGKIKNAKSIGIGSLISACLRILYFIIVFFIVISALTSDSYSKREYNTPYDYGSNYDSFFDSFFDDGFDRM